MMVLGKQFNVPVKITATPQPVQKKEEPTIIQQEGWLWKRGAGFKQSSTEPLPFSSGGSSVEEENIAASRRGSGLRLTVTPNAVASLFYGKDEKKRYFQLLTTPAATGRKQAKSDSDGPKAELRYFKKRPETEADRANLKGNIVLTADMDVSIEDNIILVHASGRTYYLRADVPEGQTAKAKTSASQWINAIRFALQGLRAYELQGAVGAGAVPHPLQDRRSIRISGLISGLDEERKAARRSFSAKAGSGLLAVSENNDDGLASDVCLFAELWHLEGIEAYERVVAHFGPALTDFQRLRDHFQSRLAQLEAELSVLDQEMGHAADVVVKEQQTIATVMKELHKSSQRHASALRECARDIKSRVIALIDSAMREISSKLETVVNRSSTAASYVEGAKKALVEAIEKVDRLQEALDAALALQQAGDSKSSQAPSRILRRKSDAPPPDPAKIENDLNDARQHRRDASQTLVITETKQAEAISKAMDELYKLEVLRLERMVNILDSAADIELRFTGKLAEEAVSIDSSLELIDTSKDIRATFARLKAAAEKTREKPRRKNSLYNRVDFSKLTETSDE